MICGVAALTVFLGLPTTSNAQRGGRGGGRGSGGGMPRGAQSFSGARPQGNFNWNNGANWNQSSLNNRWNGNWNDGNWNRNNWNGNNWNGNNWNANNWNDNWNGNRYGSGWGYYPGLGIAIGLGLGNRGYGYGGYGGYGGYPYGDYYAADNSSYYVAPAVNGATVQVNPNVLPAPATTDVQQTTNQPIQGSNTAHLNEAMNAFRNGDYQAALRAAAHAAIDDPKDARPHELAALAMLASGEYRGAAIEAHVALALAPASNWNTMVGYYGGLNEPFTTQLRSLETYAAQNPTAAEAQFLLGYLYQAMGYPEQAKTRFAEAARLVPKDEMATKMAAPMQTGQPTQTDVLKPAVEPRQTDQSNQTDVPKQIEAPTQPVAQPPQRQVPPPPTPPTSNPSGQ